MADRIFKKYRYDIALESGVGANLVAWATGLMVFFMTLALAVNLGLANVTQNWVSSLSGSVTVEIRPPAPLDGRDTLTEAQQKSFDAEVKKILSLAQKHDSVAESRVIPKDEIQALIEPWLGEKMSKDLPLPALIDVRLKDGADAAALKKSILETAPDATIDTHADTLANMQTLITAARFFVLLLTGVIILLAVVAISGMVRAKLTIHQQEIETLHLIGAQDEYIARQFRHHTLKGTLKGALAGVGAMLLTLFAVAFMTRKVEAAFAPRLDFGAGEWIVLLVSPVLLGALIAHITAQRTVLKALARLA